MRRAWVAVLVLAAAPTVAEGQIFLASRPSPEFTIGPLFVRANVTPELHAVTVDVLWSLVIPPTKSGAAIEQDLYLLWPGPVGGALTGAAPDAALSPPSRRAASCRSPRGGCRSSPRVSTAPATTSHRSPSRVAPRS